MKRNRTDVQWDPPAGVLRAMREREQRERCAQYHTAATGREIITPAVTESERRANKLHAYRMAELAALRGDGPR